MKYYKIEEDYDAIIRSNKDLSLIESKSLLINKDFQDFANKLSTLV